MTQIDLRAQIRVKRLGRKRPQPPDPSENTGWFALGVVIVLFYFTTQALLWLDRQKDAINYKSSRESFHVPESLKVSGKTKIPASTPQIFNVSADKRLVISWRNPYPCDKELVLYYRPSDNSEAALKREVWPGMGGNRIFPLVGKTSWQVQWEARDKGTRETGCKNANYGAMPEDMEVYGFQETIPSFAPAKK